MKTPNSALAGASDFLHLLGIFCIGFMWAKMVTCVLKNKKVDKDLNPFQEAKIVTGKYYMANVLPKTAFLAKKIKTGDKIVMSMDPDQF